MYSVEEIKIANKTSRASGAVGHKAVVPKAVLKLLELQPGKVLDFGAGRLALHAQKLKNLGYDVDAYEFGENFNPVIHVQSIADRYDIVYASNVINVQSSEAMLRTTLKQISTCLKDWSSVFIFNYPRSPRKLGLAEAELLRIVNELFYIVKTKSGQATIYVCNKRSSIC